MSPEFFILSPMAGYSGKPLGQKLGIKPGMRVCVQNQPQSLELGFAGPESSDLDVTLFFTKSLAELERTFPALIERTVSNGSIWISWPKKSSGVATDLNENIVRDLGLAAGVVDVKVCAVDEVWSGLKFVRRLKDRV